MICLDKIVGITKSECECVLRDLPQDKIDELRESTSGLYLDNISGFIGLESIKDLSVCSDFADLTLGARDNAIKYFEVDLITALNHKSKPRKKYIGEIGERSYTRRLDTEKDIQVMKITPHRISDAFIKIDVIGLILDAEITTQVKVYKSVNGNEPEEIHSEEITTTANRMKTNSSNLKLPLSKEGRAVEYFITYDRKGAKPMNNRLFCNCSGGSASSYYINVNSWETEAGQEFETPGNKQKKDARGMHLGIEIQCSSSSFLCREIKNSDAYSKVASWAILYKTAELVIQGVLDSKEISRTTMMSREQLYGKRNHYRKEYNDRIAYLESITETSNSDCYNCRTTRMNRTAVFS